jgi:hypothetical protein
VVQPPEVGEIIRLRSWHGIVLERFRSDEGKTILRVQTARNVFRGLPPEFIEFDLAPEQIEPATREDLQREITQHHEMLEYRVQKLLEGPNGQNDTGE